MAKRIVILGAGESGAGEAVLAKKQGFDTFVSDMSTIKDSYKNMLNERGIEWEEGKHTESLILNADEVIKSPGTPNDAPMILKLKAQGTPIISEIEFAGRYTNAKMICITGSNGKTVVKEWISQLWEREKALVRSPKSYNSQLGVALSLAMLNDEPLAVVEAGNFRKGGKERVERVDKTEKGVLSQIREAEREKFLLKKEKIEEKLGVGGDVYGIIYLYKD